MKKNLFILIALSAMFSSCSNDSDESVETTSVSKISEKTSNAVETIITDKGEVIMLTDTTVYQMDLGDLYDEESTSESWCTNTRSTGYHDPMRIEVKGYDTKTQVSSYVKVLTSKDDAEKYGLVRGNIYLTCNYHITKELAMNKDESIKPRNYINNPDNTAMGWIPGEFASTGHLLKGFEVPSNSVNNYATAKTMLKYINCDLSGKTINRFIPYEPSDLVWQYVLNYTPGWD